MDDDDRGYWVTKRTADVRLKVDILLHDVPANKVKDTLRELIPNTGIEILDIKNYEDAGLHVWAYIDIGYVSWGRGGLMDACIDRLTKIAPDLYDVDCLSADYDEYEEEEDWSD